MEQTKVAVAKQMHKNQMLHMNIVALILFSISIMILAGGCASFDRAGNSGYFQKGYETPQVSASSERREFERESAESELGAAPSERAIAYRQALKRQEKMIEGKSEREQYYKAKPYLKNDAERLQFLRLNSTADRDRYMNSKGINGDQVAHPPEFQSLIEQNDIAIGMTRQAVREAWGVADEVEVAGNKMYGNEKWKYSEQVTSREGYMTEHRTVVFEGGRVVGWETR